MNHYRPVLLLARKSLMVLGGVVIFCAALVFGLSQLAGQSKISLTQQQAALQGQKALLETKQADLLNVREHIKRYSELRAQGLVGEPDRALWVEQLQDSYRRAGLVEEIAVQLPAPKALSGNAAAGALADPSASEPLAHDLKFEMRNAVETDVLSLLHNYQTQVKGRFRVNFCKLFDAQIGGLSAQCVLRFISIPVPPVPPA